LAVRPVRTARCAAQCSIAVPSQSTIRTELAHCKKQRVSPNRKIKRQSLPETLAEALRERILNGEFKEGEALIQDAIAQEYDVSRMPVREALRQLEACGLVVMHLHNGAVVNSVPTEQIAELFELRALLECDLLARAIPRMTEEHLAASQSVLTALEASYTQADVASWGRLNWEFHRSLYLAADRVQTLTIVQGINLQTDRYIRLQLLLTRGIEDAEKEHREILRLCKRGDAERATTFLGKHIASAGRNLLVALRESRAASAA
jgi:DNA-binding GntR family transcriptional regulator